MQQLKSLFGRFNWGRDRTWTFAFLPRRSSGSHRQLNGKGGVQHYFGPRSKSDNLRLVEAFGSIRVVISVSSNGVVLVHPFAGSRAIASIDMLRAEGGVADRRDGAVDGRGKQAEECIGTEL